MNNMNKISIYDLNPRYFKDSTSTGVGDLKGLSSKFGYFSFLGVDAIIIQDLISSGINSELKSFQNVAHELGDLNDFKLLESHAKKNNVKIFIELKIGGIKESHSWYSIAKEEMTLKNGTLVDFKNSKDKIPLTAKYDKDVNAYISIDEATQEIPLNWNSERTIQKFIEVIRFWKDLGVSGFVLKDFEFISNKTRTASMSVETLTELRKFYRAIKLVDADIIVIAKSGIVPLEDILDFTIGKNKVFDYFQTTKLSMHGTGSKFGNDEIGKFKPKKLFSDISKISINPSIIMAFGTENSGRITSRWGDDGQYREASAKSLALLSFLTPASNTIYYADELGAKNIGLTHLDNFQDKTLKQRKNDALEGKLSNEKFMDAQVLQSPINSRSLMMWNSKKNGGFSFSEKTISPLSSEYIENNVEIQYSDEHSILNFYKILNEIIHTSTYAEIISEGSFKTSSIVSLGSVIKLVSTLREKELITYINLSNSPAKIISRPKEGEVILSTYPGKQYSELPKKLSAFESIIISKNTDEFIRKTQEIKINKLKTSKAIVSTKKQKEFDARVEKEKTQSIKLKNVQKEAMDLQKEFDAAAKIENKFLKRKAKKDKAKLINIEKMKKIKLLEIQKNKHVEGEFVKEASPQREFDDIKRRIHEESTAKSSIINDIDTKDITSLRVEDVAPTTQIDMDDIDDIEEFLKRNK